MLTTKLTGTARATLKTENGRRRSPVEQLVSVLFRDAEKREPVDRYSRHSTLPDAWRKQVAASMKNVLFTITDFYELEVKWTSTL